MNLWMSSLCPCPTSQKLQAKSTRCIFVGYDEHLKAFRCDNPKTKKIMVSKDVMFDEDVMGFQTTFPTKEMMAKPMTDTISLSLSEEPGIDVRWPRKGVEETQLGENVFKMRIKVYNMMRTILIQESLTKMTMQRLTKN